MANTKVGLKKHNQTRKNYVKYASIYVYMFEKNYKVQGIHHEKRDYKIELVRDIEATKVLCDVTCWGHVGMLARIRKRNWQNVIYYNFKTQDVYCANNKLYMR